MTDNLGRLQRVPLREVWLNESTHFTPWLARPENLQLLGETLKLELEVDSQEKAVGPFRADILCKESTSDTWVLVENQLERTDHSHLGQLLTYAAGLNAVVLVWIAERFTDEHRAALDWLNELGNERLRCFGLEIELWRIGASPVAPKFNVVSEPNDWSRTGASVAEQVAAGTLTETKQLQLEYWTELAKLLGSSGSSLRPQKPLPQNWTNFALGRSGIHLAAVASTFSAERGPYDDLGEIRAEVYTDHPTHSRAYFAALASHKGAIEESLGEPLNWDDTPGRRAQKIFFRRGADIRNRPDWPAQHEWLKAKLEALHRVFRPRVQQLSISANGAAVPGAAEPLEQP
jgi:hypothetical protein